jgi:hypothetical protein
MGSRLVDFRKKPLEKELGASFKFNKLVFGG